MRWGKKAVEFINTNWENHNPHQIADMINNWLSERTKLEERTYTDNVTPTAVMFQAAKLGFITIEKAFAFKEDVSRNRKIQRYIEPSLRILVLNRDNNKCLCCGSIKELELDHIVPVNSGGISVESNLQTLCKECHKIKGLDTVDFRKPFNKEYYKYCCRYHFRNLSESYG